MDRATIRDAFICIVATVIFTCGVLIGSRITSHYAVMEKEVAISNAVAMVEDTRIPLTCKDNDLIQAIKSMAMNGVHTTGYKLWLEIANDYEEED